jgi:hypothetical protein
MIDTIYNNEIENLKIILNSKNILQNIFYKIKKDKNSIDFFNNLINNIEKYDELDENKTSERMHKYYFKNDFNSMYKIIKLFYLGLKKEEKIKNKTGKSIARCCSVFPDYTGEKIIKILGYFPLMKLFNKRIEILEFLKSKVDLNKKIMGQTITEQNEEDLFNKARRKVNITKDNSFFIDYKLKNKYIEFLEEDLKIELKEINKNINILLKILNKNEDINENLLILGISFWDSEIKNNSEEIKELKEAFSLLFESFNKDKKEKLNKIKLILKEEILKELKISENELSINLDKKNNKDSFDYFLKIKTNLNLKEEDKEKISKLYLIKKDYEIEKIRYIDHRGQKYIFECKVDLN